MSTKDKTTIATVDEARAAIEADKAARAEKAARGIKHVFDDCRCRLVALPIILPDGRLAARVTIVADDLDG